MLNRPFTKSKNSLSKQGFVQNLPSENEFHFICTRIEIIIFIAMVSHGLLSLWRSSGGSRVGARVPAPPPTLFFDQNFFPNFLKTAPPRYLRVWMTAQHPPPLTPPPPSPSSPTEERLEETRKSPPSQNVWFPKMQLKLSKKNATCSYSYPPVVLLMQTFGVIYNKRCNFSYP